MIILKNNAPFLSFLTEAGATLFAISVVRYFDYLALVSTSPLPSVLTLTTPGKSAGRAGVFRQHQGGR
jgi:hypothetical protein